MTSLRYGLKLSQNATMEQYRAVWRIADEAGFDHCWCMDHFAAAYAAVGVTDLLLILHATDPAAQAGQAGELLPRLRAEA